ncbi:hypothetical protein HYH02_013140 [Chlamydomonas schloesseri]|uniref:Uncharacterized protein n=1 Tax=Chlamydomonas schloesseri TaxID=2026947 RepID=A0A835W0S8_9CHLO|nr:hypothetical protein HYH02_013140 [Chlamydomonas schloesseri]|eukprot:KAG2431921.1 hypothetical protein HYH02_013140 [Chlamydomonas schloesseri]
MTEGLVDSVELDDGAQRHTLATATNKGVPEALPAEALRSCPDFSSAATQLRAAVSATGAAYAGILDQLLYGDATADTSGTTAGAAAVTARAAGDDATSSAGTAAVPSEYRDAVKSAESLEHFHLFEPSRRSPAASATVDAAMLAMHSDIGLFLVMTPAELFPRAPAASSGSRGSSSSAVSPAGAQQLQQQQRRRTYARDLVVQLPDGSVAAPVLPDGALLVMNGEGLTRWMRQPPPGRVRPYSPLHAVLSSDLGGGVRAWFGRMFMPPHNARLQVAEDDVNSGGGGMKVTAAGDHNQQAARHSSRSADVMPRSLRAAAWSGSSISNTQQGHPHPLQMTFAEYRQLTHAQFHDGGRASEASAAGCSPTRRLLVDENSCGADQIYCWMSCMAIPANATCGKSDIVCASTKNASRLWPQDFLIPATNKPTHCFDCAPTCPNTPAPPSTSRFCNTALGATTMWMTGFQFSAGHESGPCVVFLFPEWVLDSKGKFAGACIGTFLMGVAVGALGWLRNGLRDAWVAQGRWDDGYPYWWRTWLGDAAIIAIIAVQVCLGYWLMLIGMTYQAELFLMVVLGLAPDLLTLAAASGSRKCCQRLIDKLGLDPKRYSCGIAAVAAERGHVALLTWLVEEQIASGHGAAEGACRGGQLHVLSWLRQWCQADPSYSRCNLRASHAAAAAEAGHVEVLEYVMRRVPVLATSAAADRQRERELVAAEDGPGGSSSSSSDSSSGGSSSSVDGAGGGREEDAVSEKAALRLHSERAKVLTAIARGCPVEVLRRHFDRLWHWRGPLPPLPPQAAGAAGAGAAAGGGGNMELRHRFPAEAQNHSNEELAKLVQAVVSSPTPCWAAKLDFLLSPDRLGPALATEALHREYLDSAYAYAYAVASTCPDFLARLKHLRTAGVVLDTTAALEAAFHGHPDALVWLWDECGVPADVSEGLIAKAVRNSAANGRGSSTDSSSSGGSSSSADSDVPGVLRLLKERGAVFSHAHVLVAIESGHPEACVLWLLGEAAATAASGRQQPGGSGRSECRFAGAGETSSSWAGCGRVLDHAARPGYSLRLLRELRAHGAPVSNDLGGIALHGSLVALEWPAGELESEGRPLQAVAPMCAAMLWNLGRTATLDWLERTRMLMLAAASGHLPSLDAALAQCGCVLKSEVLLAAAASGSQECCERLLELGLRLDYVARNMAEVAAERGHLLLLEWLFRIGPCQADCGNGVAKAAYGAAAEGACRGGQLHVLSWLRQRCQADPGYSRSNPMTTHVSEAAAEAGHVEVLEYVMRRVPVLAPSAAADRLRERELVAAEDGPGGSSSDSGNNGGEGGGSYGGEYPTDVEHGASYDHSWQHSDRFKVLTAIARGCPVEVLRRHFDRLWRWRGPLPAGGAGASGGAVAGGVGGAADGGVDGGNMELQQRFPAEAQNHKNEQLAELLRAAATSPTPCWADKLDFLLSPACLGPALGAMVLQRVRVDDHWEPFYFGLDRCPDALVRLQYLRAAGTTMSLHAAREAARGGHTAALAWLWDECGVQVEAPGAVLQCAGTGWQRRIAAAAHVSDGEQRAGGGGGGGTLLDVLLLLRKRGAGFTWMDVSGAMCSGWPEVCVLWLVEAAAAGASDANSSRQLEPQQDTGQQAIKVEWHTTAIDDGVRVGYSLRLLRALRAHGATITDLDTIATYGSVEALEWAAAELEAEGRPLQVVRANTASNILNDGCAASLDWLQARGLLPPLGECYIGEAGLEWGSHNYRRLRPWLQLRDQQAKEAVATAAGPTG